MEKLFVLEAIQKGRDFGEVLQMWRESWETAKKDSREDGVRSGRSFC